jgi:ATP-dependent DNA helicase RecG
MIPKKESDKVEFKPVFNNAVVEALVAFSNTKGGVVYVGVGDNSNVVGVTLGKETLPQFINEIKNKTSPSIVPDAEIVNIGNKRIVILSVNDKIEFYNPGCLPDSISVNDLLSNNYKSTPRNKRIAEFFKELGLIEKYGSGIQRIINYFKEENLPLPEFKNISDGFQVTVFAAEVKDSAENATEKNTGKAQKNYRKGIKKLKKDQDSATENATENGAQMPQKDHNNAIDKAIRNQQLILYNILKNPHITSDELSVIVGIRADSIRRNIVKLKANGFIERVGTDKDGYWKVLRQ